MHQRWLERRPDNLFSLSLPPKALRRKVVSVVRGSGVLVIGLSVAGVRGVGGGRRGVVVGRAVVVATARGQGKGHTTEADDQ